MSPSWRRMLLNGAKQMLSSQILGYVRVTPFSSTPQTWPSRNDEQKKKKHATGQTERKATHIFSFPGMQVINFRTVYFGSKDCCVSCLMSGDKAGDARYQHCARS